MGNGVYFKMIGYCHQNKNLQNGDIEVEKNNLRKISYNNYQNKSLSHKYISEEEIQNKKDQKIIATKSKISSGSGSINKPKQIFIYENSSNKDPNLSICNNTFQMNNSNFMKNNLIQNNLNNNKSLNPIDELRHKNSIINFNQIGNQNLKDNVFDIKTKLILNGHLFSNETIEINKYGMKNGLRKRQDGLSIFGVLDKNNDLQNIDTYDYYIDIEKINENNNENVSGRVFEIYINKKNKSYTLYYLHNTLILYYKINNKVFFDLDKDYYLILGDIFLTIMVKKNPDTKEKIIQIQTEIENEKPNKYTYAPKEMPIKIGRVNCNIKIPRPSISKLHSIIDYANDNFYYKDCGSTNGSTLFIREDDSLKISGEMSFKLEDISFKIKEIYDKDNSFDEN